ncbi:variant erythrocyte surface antigen-1 alpha subunit [Babesia bovis T2Bo]|uniref:Variant erythrocyte surface antigen-1, alpha subunit n=1 Tax=Babesia bovis TaxID=5865 RepID=A7ASP6_BABBO|nr:variant erythrocyte surface antigen-1 alpha subunit [Babesia bovis T2Bo]EDO07565.1 variant erythrocyte surface antigen-1 alpha subunit [Babesia bovis T2Bo]|eukprot:XP_001611133.1 variant erythrocyte surface antigen-1, alpha subunit [Babesia bovis T2Bo]
MFHKGIVANGTPVVRTYIDQLAQVLSALIGWSKLEKCTNGKGDKCKGNKNNDPNGAPHGGKGCTYLQEVKQDDISCAACGCMKWEVPKPGKGDKGHHLGRGCTRCSDSGNRDACQCDNNGGACTGSDKCKCAKKGKCCKCCCTNCKGKCKDEKERKCRCTTEESIGHGVYKDSYMSAYTKTVETSSYFEEVIKHDTPPTWSSLMNDPNRFTSNGTPSKRRQHCARIFLGSVCLIWSGLSQLGWLTKGGSGSGNETRWKEGMLSKEGDGLGSFMAAMGYNLERLNQGQGKYCLG